MSVHPQRHFFNHQQHRLRVRGCAAELDVLNFSGEDALSSPFSWLITFTCRDKNLAREALLLKPAALSLQPAGEDPGEPLRVIQGIVTGFDALGVSPDEGSYRLQLQPRLALLSRSRQNAIFQDMSVPQIVEAILRDRHGLRGQDFLFTLRHDYPRREQVMQYGEDDLRFITRLLGEVGIWFRFTTDRRLSIDVVEFYDGPQGYLPALSLPAEPPSGLLDNGTEAVWALVSRYRVVEKSVSTRDYNYRDASADMNASAELTAGDSTTWGESYHWGDDYLTPGDGHGSEPPTESGAFYARLRHERYLNQQTCLSAVSSHAALMPGSVVKVSGDNVTDIFRDGVLIVALTSSAARDRRLETRFSAIPARGRYGFRPQPPQKPLMAGTLPARVTSTARNDTYGHIDRDGRYRVNLLFDRHGWQSGFESLWVRQARPYAGDTCGLHLPLLAGTEVAIAFEHGDPDRPYIAGVLHDSAHGDHVTIRNYQRNVLRTPANNKLRLDDTRGQEHIKLSTEYGGKSQLNLGHNVNSTRKPRGEGAELRTDSWVAVRGGKGVLVSADKQTTADGEMLAMNPAVSLVKGAELQMKEWGAITRTHRSFEPDASHLQAFLATVEQLQSPSIVLSAPQGIAAVTPDTLLLRSGKNLQVQSAAEITLASAQRTAVNASLGISLLAQSEGLRLVSGKGPLTVASHGDGIDLTALQDIRVQSVQGSISLIAKNGIVLGCGGAAIRITAEGDIQIHSPGKITLKGSHILDGPVSETFPLPELPQSVCKECLRKAQATAMGVVFRE